MNVHRILVIVPNWIGDVAMCTPALRALHARFPDADLCVAGPPTAVALLDGLPWIAHTYTLPRQSGLRILSAARSEFRKEQWDLCVIFPHSFRAALFSWASGAKRRLGYGRNRRAFLLTDTVAPATDATGIAAVYMGKEYLDLVASLGCRDDGIGLELRTNGRAIARVKEHLVDDGPFVGIAPAAAYGPSKCWPAERFAEVADRLAQEAGVQCVLLTGPGEVATRDAVLRAAKTQLLVCDEGYPTIESLKATIANLDLLICNDSGPRHIGVAFKVPTVCIMGPTSPSYSNGPYERGKVLRVDVDCGPCQKPVCATDHRCMLQVQSQEVVETALSYLPKARV